MRKFKLRCLEGQSLMRGLKLKFSRANLRLGSDFLSSNFDGTVSEIIQSLIHNSPQLNSNWPWLRICARNWQKHFSQWTQANLIVGRGESRFPRSRWLHDNCFMKGMRNYGELKENDDFSRLLSIDLRKLPTTKSDLLKMKIGCARRKSALRTCAETSKAVAWNFPHGFSFCLRGKSKRNRRVVC